MYTIYNNLCSFSVPCSPALPSTSTSSCVKKLKYDENVQQHPCKDYVDTDYGKYYQLFYI